jgi:pantothenate kinase
MPICYIDTPTKDAANWWTARVVTDQDYHERGPHAHSHQSIPLPTRGAAERECHQWAEAHGYTVVTASEVA